MQGLLLTATGFLASVAATLPASAQPRPPVAAQVAPTDGRAVVAEVRRIIAETYVLPERRPAIDALLAEGLAAGRYDVRDPALIAERINADLARANDRHLNFRHNPEQAAMFASASRASGPDPAAFQATVRARNHGVRELKVLPGNVRYMAYDGFDWLGEETTAALDVAMRFLSGGDAVIIDLRQNGGGSPQAVQYIVSHFMEANRPLVTFHMNGQADPDTLSTLAEVPAGRMIGKPLYVLTSSATGSAAEEFTGHVGGYRLGELVGGNTGGAGFRNTLVPIGGTYILSVSVGRAVLASTGKDWEAVGHAPTMPTPVAAALDTAHAHALRRLAATATGPRQVRLNAIAEGLGARGERRTPGAPLTAYAGQYGERAVTIENGRLFYQRGDRPREQLVPLGGHRFIFDSAPETVVEFTLAGAQANGFSLGAAGGPIQGRYERGTVRAN